MKNLTWNPFDLMCKFSNCSKDVHVKGYCKPHYMKLYHEKKITVKKYESHGMRHSPEYQSWRHMKHRCNNPANPHYQNWGGRGITVFPEWVNSFSAFYAYVGPKPGPDYSIDRIDNNGNYEPGNVKWSTPLEQANNTRPRSNKHGYPGVSKSGTRYSSAIRIKGRSFDLGRFETAHDAHLEYSIAKEIKSRLEYYP